MLHSTVAGIVGTPAFRRFRLLSGLLIVACGQATLTPALIRPDAMPAHGASNDTLKVHMNSGELFILSTWSLDSVGRLLMGMGTRFDLARAATDVRAAAIPIDSVALLETSNHGAAWPLGQQGVAVLTLAGAYVSAVCLSDPKACFGSCPTFYMEGDDPDRVQAEGFSASVARVLEARDVDALVRPGMRGKRLALHMRNEAWETHVVRAVNLLAVPKPANGNVFVSSDSVFYPATDILAPASCIGAEGNCLSEIAKLDGVERSSPADSLDLAAREILELTFPSAPSGAGIVLSARNSLITTFLFYQTMAYAGSTAGAIVASMERGGRQFAESHFGMARLLGAIEVQLRVAREWRTIGEFGEPGPIAADTKVIPLPPDAASDGPVHVRLRLAKGNWRLDWVALATLGEPVVPVRIAPTTVQRGGRTHHAAVAAFRDGGRPLVSLPGDDYRLMFDLPAPAETLELFLESQGYYYEWMRPQWLAEENHSMAALALLDPATALRQLAPEYKAREPRMEQLFWQSRFNRQEADSHDDRQ